MKSATNQRQNCFTREQNNFICYLVQTTSNMSNERERWRDITKIFKDKYPEHNYRPNKAIKNHFNNTLNGTLKKDQLSEEESNQLTELTQKFGTRFQFIASIMGRTENSVKNHYYRKLKKCINTEEIHQYYVENIFQIDEDVDTKKIIESESKSCIFQYILGEYSFSVTQREKLLLNSVFEDDEN